MQVSFSGIIKAKSDLIVSAAQTARADLPAEAVPLHDDRLHVTLVHQSIAKPWKKEFRDAVLPDCPDFNLLPDVQMREDGDRRSWVLWVDDEGQYALKAYVLELLGVDEDPEPQRRFHISLANLTGEPGDSVR